MRTLTLIESASRALLRLAPRCFRLAWQDELVSSVRESCLDAYRAAGLGGLVLTGVLEMSSVGGSAIRARLGGGPSISSGHRRQSDDDQPSKGTRLMRLLRNDLRLAVRSMLAARTAVAIAVLTLALGVGVNAAVFSVLDSTLFRPLPYAEADRFGEVWTKHADNGLMTPGSAPAAILEWRRQTDLFDRVEAYDIATFIHEDEAGAQTISGSFVTPGMLSLLGVRPIMGRVFAADEGQGGTADRIVISERLWQQRFLADPDILDRSILLNGIRHDVVGIMPASFRFPNTVIQFWVPYSLEQPPAEASVSPSNLRTFVRMAPGVTAERAAEMIDARGEAVQAAAGFTDGRTAISSEGIQGDIRNNAALYVLGGTVAFLLLIICANLANLSLSRALTRTRDFGVRASLGASRTDLVRESLVEHALVGLIGAGLGLFVAKVTLAVALDALPTTMFYSTMNAVDLDPRALAFTAAAGLAAALLFGMPAAWLASRSTVADALRATSRASTGSRSSRRIRSALVVAEVALAIVLLVGAALMARSFVKLQSVDRGFTADNLVTLQVGMPTAGYADPYARDAFVSRLLDDVRKIPGVNSATAGGVPPSSDMVSFGELEFAEKPGEPSDLAILPIYEVWPDYFDTVDIPILQGRPFEDGEPAESVIVSESFARQHFGDTPALGRKFRLGDSGPWKQIVGVSGEVRQLDMADSMTSFEMFYPGKRPPGLRPPTRQSTRAIADYQTIVVRAEDPESMTTLLPQAVHRLDPRVVVQKTESVEQMFADAVARPRVVLLLMTVFAGMGLVLAAAGIYGVLSYLVTQRRREIGIRLALGAVPQSVGRLIMRNGLTLTAVGLMIGVVAAINLVGVMQALLYEVEGTDLLSIAGVAGVLLLTATLASWWPAQRAMRMNPVALLKEE